MIFNVGNVGKIELNTIVLDLNGTLSVNGKVVKGAKKRLLKLEKLGYKIILFTGDQRGTAKSICDKLNIEYKITKTAKDKGKEMAKLDLKTCVAIGNARIDIETLKMAKISILTLQSEGIHTETIKYADIIVPNINDALGLLINNDSFCATMKK